MAKLETYKMSVEQRRRRTFSESFKRKKVGEIEQKITTVSQVCKQYEVSQTNVYKWLSKYGDSYKKGIKTIVEMESDTRKILELRKQMAELERIIGQKQIQIEFRDKMIELAEETYGVDIKKKFDTEHSSGSGKTAKS
jgi:transposase-like protein